ncbi:MAG: DNA repair protein RecN, partial [Bacteroidetes bacterium]|nr:DNA repair protein RecN [Bacteroidota bacterium]
TIIRREINPVGKSRAFINDTPVNLTTLRSLSDKLVNLHSQHETLNLNSAQFQVDAIDFIAQQESAVKEYKDLFNVYYNKAQQLETLLSKQQDHNHDLDYLKFQLEELIEAAPQAGEQEELEDELQTLQHAEDIKRNLLTGHHLLSDEEGSATQRLQGVINLLDSISSYHQELGKLAKRIDSSLIELNDISKELDVIEQSTSYDGDRIQLIQERLDLLYRLEKKHKVNSDEELIEVKNTIETKLEAIDNSGETLEQLEKEVKALYEQATQKAMALSATRKKYIPRFEQQVNDQLIDLSLPGSSFTVSMESNSDGHLQSHGIDNIKFLFSANKGSEPQELKKIASGGELSRLMLAIKSLIAATAAMPTLIFDEIDTGVSGETAVKVGSLLNKLSNSHQVICITHLPQIASKGNSHYFVYKQEEDNRTVTHIRKMDDDERIVEIAKMLSGEKPTDAALQNARELLLN